LDVAMGGDGGRGRGTRRGVWRGMVSWERNEEMGCARYENACTVVRTMSAGTRAPFPLMSNSTSTFTSHHLPISNNQPYTSPTTLLADSTATAAAVAVELQVPPPHCYRPTHLSLLSASPTPAAPPLPPNPTRAQSERMRKTYASFPRLYTRVLTTPPAPPPLRFTSSVHCCPASIGCVLF